MNPVRVGILGTGAVVRQFHLPALVNNPRATVTAVGNLKQASMQSVCDKFGIGRAFTDFERFARDPEIDAVVVALPNYLHASVTCLMLRHGKHVLCEKPMAMTAAEAREMVAAAEVANRKLIIGHVWRCHPEVRWLRAIVESGRLGEVQRVKAHAVAARRGPKPGSWFLCPENSGGGALADVGIHSIDTISYLFGDRLLAKSVTAQIDNRYEPLDVEDTASVRIEYNNGMVAEIEAGWYHEQAVSPHGAIELFGTNGYARTLPAEFESFTQNVTDAVLLPQTSAHPPLTPALSQREREHAVVPPHTSAHPDANLAVYAAQIDQFLDCILENRQPACDGHQGVRDMVILESAYRAAQCGSCVSVAPSWEFQANHREASEQTH